MELIGFAIAQVVLLAAGVVTGAVCCALVWWTQRRKLQRRGGMLAFVFFLPTIALFYIEGSYIAYGLVEDAMGRDSYVEGIYHYPLVNGYELVIMDKMPEQAYIDHESGPGTGVSEVREFQVSGNTLLVTSHRDVSGTDWGADKPADQFQIIDTATGSVRSFSSYTELASAAASLGITLDLQTVQDALSKAAAEARPGLWFVPLLFVPVLVIAWWYHARERASMRTLSPVE